MKNSEISIRLIIKPNRKKMINLKLRDEIQNIIYRRILIFVCSVKSELKENQTWATKISTSIPNK